MVLLVSPPRATRTDFAFLLIIPDVSGLIGCIMTEGVTGVTRHGSYEGLTVSTHAILAGPKAVRMGAHPLLLARIRVAHAVALGLGMGTVRVRS